MANLTVAIDDELLQRARIRALEQSTSVNALLRDYLAAFVGARSTREQDAQAVLEISRQSTSRRGGRTWTRGELHER